MRILLITATLNRMIGYILQHSRNLSTVLTVKVLPETMTTLSMHVSPAAAIEPISKATSLLEFKS